MDLNRLSIGINDQGDFTLLVDGNLFKILAYAGSHLHLALTQEISPKSCHGCSFLEEKHNDYESYCRCNRHQPPRYMIGDTSDIRKDCLNNKE